MRQSVRVALLTSFTLFALALGAQPLSISTIAGNTRGGGHVDARGLEARFSLPQGIAYDSAGMLYVADTGNHVIRRVAPDGTVTTFAGRVGDSGSNDGGALSA
ncbi:MAG TPA: hypothetical protein VF846_02775, partial [Thermoanaerobaculia bacterium]